MGPIWVSGLLTRVRETLRPESRMPADASVPQGLRGSRRPLARRPSLSTRRACVGRAVLALGGAAASAGFLWLSAAGKAGSVVWIALVPAAAVALHQEGTRLGRMAVPLAVGLYLELEFLTALPFGIAAGQWGSPIIPLTSDSPILFAALAVPILSGALYALRFGQPLIMRNARGAAWAAKSSGLRPVGPPSTSSE